MKDERFGKTESESKELAEVRKELAEERAAMELYGFHFLQRFMIVVGCRSSVL